MTDGAATFRSGGDSYTRYMGEWSRPLARAFVAAVGVDEGASVLDVGCGAGSLTVALVEHVGSGAVAAIDPSEQQVVACAAAAPSADVRIAGAEAIPFQDEAFDATLAQLVLNFLDDAPAGVEEMCRVTRPGGTVAACTWDYREGMTMLRVFWDAARALDPGTPGEGQSMAYCSRDELERLWLDAGLTEVETGSLTVTRVYTGFDDYWETFGLGIGPGGAYYASLDDARREQLRLECFSRFGEPVGPLSMDARAWLVRGVR